jgi:hypothetical protein
MDETLSIGEKYDVSLATELQRDLPEFDRPARSRGVLALPSNDAPGDHAEKTITAAREAFLLR